jgi:anti-anti-sigma factor
MSEIVLDELSLRIEFDVEPLAVTLWVGGEIDMLTAPSVASVLRSLVDSGRRQIVVDLSDVEFVDGRGAEVFAEAARLVVPIGGAVIIRAASALTRRMLALTGGSDELIMDPSNAAFSQTGLRSLSRSMSRISAIEGSGAVTALTGLARSSTDMVDAALRLVTTLADETVANADGVSVTLERHGRLMTVAASNDKVLTMDRHQYETGEGPCLEAKAQGRWFYIESLADETRWPRFVPLALGQGIHSILSSPLKTSERAQGALNMYSTTKQAFGEREQELAALFADQASQILTAAGQDATDEDTSQRFAAALATRQLIHQAQGVIMARKAVTAQDAIGSLFRDARSGNVTVVGYATELIGSLLSDTGTP